MKRNNLTLLSAILLGLCLTLGGCQRSEIPTFDDAYSSVRVPYATSDNKEHSGYNDEQKCYLLTYSFIGKPGVVEDSVEIPVIVVGRASDQDRPIRVEVVPEQTTATTAEYEVLSAVVKAGELQGTIKVKVHKTERLSQTDLNVRLRLMTNDYFQKQIKDLSDIDLRIGAKVPAPMHRLHIKTYHFLIDADPDIYSETLDYYSPSSMQAIVDALGWTDWDSEEIHGADYNDESLGRYKYLPVFDYVDKGERLTVFRQTLSKYIEQYNQSHPDAPLVHDAGLLKGKPVKVRQ